MFWDDQDSSDAHRDSSYSQLPIQSNEHPKQRIQPKTPKVRIHIDNAKTLNRFDLIKIKDDNF